MKLQNCNNLIIGDYKLHDYTNSLTASENFIDNSLPSELFESAKLILFTLTFLNKSSGYKHSITSGYRCPELNKLVDGHPNSFHQSALAVDFKAADVECDLSYVSKFKRYATWFVKTIHSDNVKVDVIYYPKKKIYHLEIEFIS